MIFDSPYEINFGLVCINPSSYFLNVFIQVEWAGAIG